MTKAKAKSEFYKDTTIPNALLDELMEQLPAMPTQENLFGPEGVVKQLSAALIERCLQAELSTHLGYEKNERAEQARPNHRNGYTQKTLKSDAGEIELAIPRDREGSYDPLLVKRGQTSLTGFTEKILWLYAHGLSTRDIQAQMLDWYGVEVSPQLISNVTEAAMDEVRQWQNRPLEELYPILYMDCLQLKVRENQRVINKAVYLALGVTMEGHKELLGMCISESEGAEFWLAVCTQLRNRGMKDCYIAWVDGLTGFPEAIETVFPQTQVQLCIVHLVRNSLKYVNYKQRAEAAKDLKAIYSAATEADAEFQLELFAEKWDQAYPAISKRWRTQWSHVVPLFSYPEEIRKVIYTTNAIESVNMTLRKVTRNHRIFPSDDAVYKVLYLAIQNITKKWSKPIFDWKAALNYFSVAFAERFPQGILPILHKILDRLADCHQRLEKAKQAGSITLKRELKPVHRAIAGIVLFAREVTGGM